MSASIEPAYPRVSFQGELGAYGDSAIAGRWRGRAVAMPARTFEEALAMVCAGRSDYAVIPVWNSTLGDLRTQRRALADHLSRAIVVDELVVPVQHCLIALPAATLDTIRVVGSHPAALAQCERFFRMRRKLTQMEAFDTAGAARELSRVMPVRRVTGSEDGNGQPRPWFHGAGVGVHELAVIASASAARRYGLTVLAEAIQDDPGNVTRFAVVRAR